MILPVDEGVAPAVIASGSIPDALRHWAEHTPDARALTESASGFSYRELAAAVDRASAGLAARGVSAGDRVVLIGENTWQWVVAYLAVLAAGAVVVPTNTRLSPVQFAAQADFVDARLVLVDERFASIAEGVTRPVERIDLPGSFLDAHAEAPRADIDLDAPALISFTSGTTGTPKGALLSHRALAEGSRVFARVLGTSSQDSTVVLVPMFHNTGFVDQLGHMLLVGGETVLLRSFRTQAAVDELARRQVTYITAVPSIIRLVMTHEHADLAFGRARSVLYGGSPMPEAWSGELAQRWPDLRLFHGYGLTEFTSAVSFLTPDRASAHRESVGVAAPGVEVRIVDPEGRDVADGATGELIARGPTMMTEYWGAPELTARKIVDGWLWTGDLAHRVDGLLFLDGRVDDVINRGGEKVLPAFVESKLSEIAGVAEACVFGLDDPILQSRVHAVVRPREGAAVPVEGEIRAQLATVLPDYAVPETVRVWADLPRGASGKVDRRAVIEKRKQEGDGDGRP